MSAKQAGQPRAERIARDAPDYPPMLLARLGAEAPEELVVLGRRELLGAHKTALFCSARTPGHAILRAHGAARRMRERGVTVISGFRGFQASCRQPSQQGGCSSFRRSPLR